MLHTRTYIFTPSTHINVPQMGHGPSTLPRFPPPALLPAELSAASLQEISKEAVYTISSKEIIIIITLSDLAVKFL